MVAHKRGESALKYAIISDIHGNIHAFKAVLTDAASQGVDMYLLLGDYASSFPYGNDVVDIIRNLGSCVAIRGNGEGYLIDLQGRNPAELTNEQFKPVYWAYQSLSAENMEYIAKLHDNTLYPRRIPCPSENRFAKFPWGYSRNRTNA